MRLFVCKLETWIEMIIVVHEEFRNFLQVRLENWQVEKKEYVCTLTLCMGPVLISTIFDIVLIENYSITYIDKN